MSGAAAGEPRLRDHVHGGTWFRCDGQGDAVVLIHGVGLDHNMWERQVERLKTQFQVITYDMLGHGQSAHPPDERFLGDFVRQLHHLLVNLELRNVAIVGFSMGGLVAREFAIQYPEMTTKLVLMNTVFRRSPEQRAAVMARYEVSKSGQLEDGIDAAIRRWFSEDFARINADVVDQVRARLRTNDPQGYLKAYKVFATAVDPDGTLSIACPTLAMTGELDSGSTPEMACALAEVIKQGNAKILPGLRHMAPIEGAGLVNQTLMEFLETPENKEK